MRVWRSEMPIPVNVVKSDGNEAVEHSCSLLLIFFKISFVLGLDNVPTDEILALSEPLTLVF